MSGDFYEQVSTKTDDELMDIYSNADEYQDGFVRAVSDELTRRKINFEKLSQESEKKRKARQEELEKGKEGDEAYIILCFLSAILGGILGIIAGLIYSQSKQRDNSGQKYFVYNKKTRHLGRIMIMVGFFVFILMLLWKIS